MDFITNIKYYLLTFFLLLGCFITKAQDNKVDIELRDYHSARITDVVASTRYPYFFTADESGKILAYNSESKRVVKTIRPATGIPVKNLRLTYKDEVLTVNQKFDYTNGSQDSIINIQIFNQKAVNKSQADVEFIGNQSNFIITQDTNPDKSLNIIDLFNRDFKKVNRYYVAGLVTKAAYDSISQTMAMLEGRIGKPLKVSVQIANDYENIITIDIPERLDIQELFFENSSLYAVAINKQQDRIEIYNLSIPAKFSEPQYSIDEYPSNSISIKQFYNDGMKTLIITDKGLWPLQPIILRISASSFKKITPAIENGAINAVYLKSTDEILFFESYNENYVRSIRFSVFDNETQKITGVFPEDSRPFYAGMFLPKNNWLIYGSEYNKSNTSYNAIENNIKFYNKGTFNNRFGNLSYKDYLEVHHGIVDMSFREFNINKETGVRAFYGYEKKSANNYIYGFYAYDMIEDVIKRLSNKDVVQRYIVDYNNTTGDLLLSKKAYHNAGLENPQEFIILKDELVTKLKGLYKFGKFSNNGRYLLLISENNQVIIKDLTTQKDIYSEDLKNGKYKIFAIGDQDFFLTNTYYEVNLETCNKSSKSYTVSNSNQVEKKFYDCVNLIDVASKKGIVVMAIENIGLVIGEEMYKFPYSEFPEKISLNEEASKLMVSFNNGKIKVFRLDGLQAVLEMIHLDKESHVFLNHDNFYFSNIDPDDHLIASNNGNTIPISTLEMAYFNPGEVLKSLGEPNETYLKLLNKALSLRQKNLYANANMNSDKTDSNKNINDEKRTLYVVSVGVSNYQQREYNLTFADKDALDIAKIYGNLSEKDFANYKTKFYGNQFVLKNRNGEIMGSLNKYFGQYMGLERLYPLTKNGMYWLEKYDENNYLWDFNTETIRSIDLPPGVSLDTYNLDPIFFPDADDKGFIVKSETDYYKYNFNTEEFTILKFPQTKDNQNLSSANLKILKNNRWGYFSTETVGIHNEILITKGRFETEKIERVRFSPDVFSTKKNMKKTTDSTYLYAPNFKALSSNGTHLLYTDTNGQVYYKNLRSKDELPLKINIPNLETLDELTISEDGNKFSVIKSYGEDYNHKILNYNLDGDLLSTRVLDSEIQGLSFYDDNFLWIAMSDSLVEEEFLPQDELIENNLPVSFDKTEVRHLINEEVSSSGIEELILNTFGKAKPHDQVMLFLAGHGVLDKDLKYYYAPHDMDFKDIAKNGLSLKRILESLNQSKANNKLLLMDTCHSGNTLDVNSNSTGVTSGTSGERGSKSRSTKPKPEFKLSDVVSDVFDDFLSKSGITVISASSGADVAYENKDLGNGAFTSAYINLLKNKLKAGSYMLTEDSVKKSINLSMEDISELLKQVMLLTNGKQIPDLREINTNSTIKMW